MTRNECIENAATVLLAKLAETECLVCEDGEPKDDCWVCREMAVLRAALSASEEAKGAPRSTSGSTLPGAMRPEFVHAREVAVALSRVRAGEPVAQVEDDYGFPSGMLDPAAPPPSEGAMLSERLKSPTLPAEIAKARARLEAEEAADALVDPLFVLPAAPPKETK